MERSVQPDFQTTAHKPNKDATITQTTDLIDNQNGSIAYHKFLYLPRNRFAKQQRLDSRKRFKPR